MAVAARGREGLLVVGWWLGQLGCTNHPAITERLQRYIERGIASLLPHSPAYRYASGFTSPISLSCSQGTAAVTSNAPTQGEHMYLPSALTGVLAAAASLSPSTSEGLWDLSPSAPPRPGAYSRPSHLVCETRIDHFLLRDWSRAVSRAATVRLAIRYLGGICPC